MITTAADTQAAPPGRPQHPAFAQTRETGDYIRKSHVTRSYLNTRGFLMEDRTHLESSFRGHGIMPADVAAMDDEWLSDSLYGLDAIHEAREEWNDLRHQIDSAEVAALVVQHLETEIGEPLFTQAEAWGRLLLAAQYTRSMGLQPDEP